MSYPIIPITTLVPQQSVAPTPYLITAATYPFQMMFLNNGSCQLYVDNFNTPGSTISCTVTILAVPDQAGRTGTTVTPTGYSTVLAPYSRQYFGPFRQSWWNQTTADVGYVYLTFSASSGDTLSNVATYVINF
jgi:hypothetical protein